MSLTFVELQDKEELLAKILQAFFKQHFNCPDWDALPVGVQCDAIDDASEFLQNIFFEEYAEALDATEAIEAEEDESA